jgi:RNA polymerase sigma factor (sigma-70 family)
MEPLANNSLSCRRITPGLLALLVDPNALTLGDLKPAETAQSGPDIPRLTRRMAKGEEEAYHCFHDAYYTRLLAYLLVLTRDEQLARDALQATLLRVVRHAKRFESEDAFWSWLTVLARSSVSDERRRSTRYFSFLERFFHHRTIEDQAPIEQNTSPLEERLNTALDALEPEDRQLLERKYLSGEPVRQIAQTIRLSEKAVESRLVRVRQKLREMMLAQLKNEV